MIPMLFRRFTAAIIFAVLIGAVVTPSQAQSGLVTFETDRLAIETADGERHEFAIEVARKHDEMAQGLMFRQSLPADAGMLFVYAPPRQVGMWMKNTFIPLDMLFIDESGQITKIVKRTVPQSEVTIRSGDAVRAVLELNGGTADKLGIEPGDRVIHDAFE